MKQEIDDLTINSIAFECPSLFNVLVQDNQSGIFYLNQDRFIYANPAFTKLFNTDSSLIIGQSIFDFASEQVIDELKNAIEEMKQGMRTKFSYDVAINLNGSTAYFQIDLNAQTATDTTTKIIGTATNVTEKVKMANQAMSTKLMFDALFNNIVDGIIIYDYNAEKMNGCNEAAVQLFGYDSKEELQQTNRYNFVPNSSPIFPGANLLKTTDEHANRIRNKEAFRTPGVFVKKNGDHMIVHASLAPTLRYDGEAYIIFQDSTNRVLNKKRQKATEKKYRQIFQNSHEAIIYTSVQSKEIILCNDNALDFFGIDKQEELTKELFLSAFDTASKSNVVTLDAYHAKIDEAAENGRAELVAWVKKPTGALMLIHCVLIRDSSNKKNPMVISFLRDTTKLHQTRRVLEEKNEELERYIESNLQLENFAYFASHDLQTPLRSMISFTQLLNRSLGQKLTQREREYMDFIISSSHNMRNLVNDLLSYSRINNTDIKITQIDLPALIEGLCFEMKTAIEEKDALIEIANLPQTIDGDMTKIRQIFQNLISNAIKFSQKNQCLKVTIDSQETSSHWIFSVQDNGIGIHPDFQNKIFLLFKRLHSQSEYEGTGIGLAMVKKLVDQHEGRVSLVSALGNGSTFSFSIKK